MIISEMFEEKLYCSSRKKSIILNATTINLNLIWLFQYCNREIISIIISKLHIFEGLFYIQLCTSGEVTNIMLKVSKFWNQIFLVSFEPKKTKRNHFLAALALKMGQIKKLMAL